MKEFEKQIVDAHLKKMGLNSTDDVNEWYLHSRNGYSVKGIEEATKKTLKFSDKFVYIFGDYDVGATRS